MIYLRVDVLYLVVWEMIYLGVDVLWIGVLIVVDWEQEMFCWISHDLVGVGRRRIVWMLV